MYEAPWTLIPDLIAHDWMPYSGEQSLREVAQSVVDAFQIRDGDVIIGISLGGMVACEIAKVRRLRKLILVASAVQKEEIHSFWERIHWMARFVPWRRLVRGAGWIPIKSPQMFSRNHPDFLRTMCRAVFEWSGLEQTSVPILRIHGRYDPVISCPPRPDHLLLGGHRISETHARSCVRFVLSNLKTDAMGNRGSVCSPATGA